MIWLAALQKLQFDQSRLSREWNVFRGKILDEHLELIIQASLYDTNPHSHTGAFFYTQNLPIKFLNSSIALLDSHKIWVLYWHHLLFYEIFAHPKPNIQGARPVVTKMSSKSIWEVPSGWSIASDGGSLHAKASVLESHGGYFCFCRNNPQPQLGDEK